MNAIVRTVADAVAAPPVINWETLAELLDDTHSNFDRLLHRFLVQMPERMKAIDTAWQKRDMAGLQAAAHKFKGISATFGAEALAFYCAQLEQAARHHEWSAGSDLLRKIQTEVAHLQSTLNQDTVRERIKTGQQTDAAYQNGE